MTVLLCHANTMVNARMKCLGTAALVLVVILGRFASSMSTNASQRRAKTALTALKGSINSFANVPMAGRVALARSISMSADRLRASTEARVLMGSIATLVPAKTGTMVQTAPKTLMTAAPTLACPTAHAMTGLRTSRVLASQDSAAEPASMKSMRATPLPISATSSMRSASIAARETQSACAIRATRQPTPA